MRALTRAYILTLSRTHRRRPAASFCGPSSTSETGTLTHEHKRARARARARRWLEHEVDRDVGGGGIRQEKRRWQGIDWNGEMPCQRPFPGGGRESSHLETGGLQEID